MGIHNELIANASKLEFYFILGRHICACVSVGEQQYALHSHIALVPPIKPGFLPAYPLNPTHGDISVTDQKYQNNLHYYHLVKNMNIALNKIIVAAIYYQSIKGEIYIVMVYANNSFVELIDWLYVWYVQIMHVDLMQNQDEMQAMCNVEYPINILFVQMEKGQESAIAGNFPFSDRQLADMGVAKTLAIQECTHGYRMWKSITSNDNRWVRFTENFQEAYLDR